MGIAEKATMISANNVTIAENEQRVYDSGYSQAESDFWDYIQNYGKRKTYRYGFRYYAGEVFHPKYKITEISETQALCFTFTNSKIKRIEKAYIDLTGKTIDCYYTFSACSELEVIEDLGFAATKYDNAYRQVYPNKLREIHCVHSLPETIWLQAFHYCDYLEILNIEGTIGKNGFNVSWSKLLTHDSLMSIINALEDKTSDTSGTTWKVSLGTDNIAKLTETEQLQASAKGWVLQ